MIEVQPTKSAASGQIDSLIAGLSNYSYANYADARRALRKCRDEKYSTLSEGAKAIVGEMIRLLDLMGDLPR